MKKKIKVSYLDEQERNYARNVQDPLHLVRFRIFVRPYASEEQKQSITFDDVRLVEIHHRSKTETRLWSATCAPSCLEDIVNILPRILNLDPWRRTIIIEVHKINTGCAIHTCGNTFVKFLRYFSPSGRYTTGYYTFTTNTSRGRLVHVLVTLFQGGEKFLWKHVWYNLS